MASTIKYLFIDDDDQAALISKLERASGKKLKIKRQHPLAFEKALDQFTASKFKDYDGLLIDLRLDEKRKAGPDLSH